MANDTTTELSREDNGEGQRATSTRAAAAPLWVLTASELGAARPPHFQGDARSLNLYMKVPQCLHRCWFRKMTFKIVRV